MPQRVNQPITLLRKRIYVAIGAVLAGLGLAGIFLPLLPTTPFALLAAYLFARSSQRWYDWLLTHKYLGPYIRAFRERRGLTPTQKLRIGASMVIIFGVSIYLVPQTTIRVMLGGGMVFWLTMLALMRTAAPDDVIDE